MGRVIPEPGPSAKPVDQHTVRNFAQKIGAMIWKHTGRDPVMAVTFRKRFAAIWTENGTHIWCFIEMATGDILKADSWRRPALHARGSLHAPDMDIAKMKWTGPPYLR